MSAPPTPRECIAEAVSPGLDLMVDAGCVADAILAALAAAGFAVVPRISDTERNRVIGLAEMAEAKARRFAQGMPGRDFYTDIADTLRGAVMMLAAAEGEPR